MDDYIAMLMGEMLEGGAEFITDNIVKPINRRRINKRMEPLDYHTYTHGRKRNHTRNLIVDQHISMKIKQNDPNFDSEALKEWTKDTFVKLQKAWTERNIEQLRKRLDTNLYENYKVLLETNVATNCTNVIDIQNVNYVDFLSYNIDNEKEILDLVINVVMYNYTLNDLTQEIIDGSKTIKERTTYKLKLYRKMGSKTDDERVSKCPNCGADLNSEQNKCEYCNTWILNGLKDWLLNSVDKY